jgi:hypothetical protein
MKLDRNKTGDGTGKYALVRLRKVYSENAQAHVARALDELRVGGVVDMGQPGDDDEFFVIKLKDRYAAQALFAYAAAARPDDPEYADEIVELARRATRHPGSKKPD